MASDGRNRRQLLRTVGAAGAGLLAGCVGGSSTPSEPTTPTAGSQPTTQTTDGPGTETTGADTPGGGSTTTSSETPVPGMYVASEALRDESVDIVMEGAPAGATVTVRAATRYPEGGPLAGQFESYARLKADDDGTVAVSEQAPSDGTYGGPDGMGLFWSMRPRSALDAPGRSELDTPTVDADGRTVHLRAVVDGETVAETTTRRQYVAPGVTELEPDIDVEGRVYVPPSDGPHPSAMVLHGGSGTLPTQPARLLASHGIVAMAVQYFGAPGSLPDRPVEIPLEYFEPAIDWLLSQPATDNSGVAATGLSLGGSAALLLGATYDRVDAVASTSAATVVFASEVSEGKSPFSLAGEPVPAVSVTYEDGERRDGKLATAPAFRAALERASDERVEEATIPVEEVGGDVLFVTGRRDGVINATALAERSVTRLDARDVGFPYEHAAYDDAGHLITIPYGVTTQMTAVGDRLYGGTPAGLAAAEADAWPQIKRVLRGE